MWGALSDEDGPAVYICCWPSPAQSFSSPSPGGLVTICYYCLRFKTPPTRNRIAQWYISYPLRFKRVRMQSVSQTTLASIRQSVTNELCGRKRSWSDVRYLRPDVLTVVITKITFP
jgi:hypothetical protein